MEVTGFEHLHRHSDLSILDGFAKVHEYAEYSKEVNQRFLAITDHGVMGAVPAQISCSDKFGLKPIFGCEMYINPLQPKVKNSMESAAFRATLDDDQKKRFSKSNHLLGLAYNFTGYQNLVRLTSWGWKHGMYNGKPRINHEVLKQYNEGIIFTSTCANSEIAQAFLRNMDDQEGFDMVEKYMTLVDPKHFYLELMMLDYKLQRPYDAFLIRAHQRYGLPLVLSQDCFVEDTLVLTSKGFKEIKDITTCDSVLTHKNRWRQVEATAVKSSDDVYQVKTRVGTFAIKATGNHRIRVTERDSNWAVDWKRVKNLTSKDYMLIPKVDKKFVFGNGVSSINLLSYFTSEEIETDKSCNIHSKKRLRYCSDQNTLLAYKGFGVKHEFPVDLPVDDKFLEILGWFIAEGWAEKKGSQVGFAFHKREESFALEVISYFAQFGIKSKIYKVSNNGIAVRFSSAVFNRLFSRLCGNGANNKTLPVIGESCFGVWSERQLAKILFKYWEGDGNGNESSMKFSSTSRQLIFCISTILNSLGVFNYPSRSDAANSQWRDYWYICVCRSKTEFLQRWFKEEATFFDSRPRGIKYFDLGDAYAVQIESIEKIEYDGLVYDLQISDDESFTANLWQVHNCHVCKKDHSLGQTLMLLQRNKKTMADIQAMVDSGVEDIFELQDSNLWMKSEDELNEMWTQKYSDIIDYDLYVQAKANTVRICEYAQGVELDRSIKLPEIDNSSKVLLEKIMKGYEESGLPRTKVYLDRIKKEYDLIVKKGFASYFLIDQQLTDAGRELSPKIMGWGDGSEAVGPGRGSAAGSLVARCLHLHDLDPIEHDLLFERFLSPARGGKQARLRFTKPPLNECVA